MRRRSLPLLAAALVAICLPAHAVDWHERSISETKQFIVYSPDVRLRQRVASYADDLTAQVKELLGGVGLWRTPIVVTLERASTADGQAPAPVLRLVDTPAGQKIELNVKIGNDPAAVNLPKLLLRAVLLEYSYRGARVYGGTHYVEAPWWVVEGLIEMGRRRDAGIDANLFRRLVETNHLPPIEKFLIEKPEELSPTALAVDRALAMGLLQMLVEQPDGHANLAHFIRAWPQSDGDPMALLAKEFPTVASSPETLQKWWMVNLARYAAADRFEGLTVTDTDKSLAALLQIEFVVDKKGTKKTFAVGDYTQFMKLPSSKTTLAARHAEVIALGTRANALLRPVLTDYEQIFAMLSRGKTRGVRDRLAKVEDYRTLVLKRTSDIADYLNWFEATQMKTMSGAFDNYLKTVDELSAEDKKQKGPIGQYLDQLEPEF
ncbi:hypothetical protein CfE428DRAFT_2285 [Chthoniobacter flavus Ellin428]|uniref:Uncharacterized protein n=1 Tax=Chthoniobacter flavus Ellin428 TaxID=497964 RepID=B4D047_9BACT|nr:hypothetical protein [Chthoniobacter flavus]EDY20361.1 hypothetical protein CfE428DRAFT_2285 [Chthoniobacter flavus Ellin428]TCO94254.1 hypothetical protein EV701_103343 [Chthoniobacter flavus]